MPITTLSSRELNQDIGRARRAAERGPVFTLVVVTRNVRDFAGTGALLLNPRESGIVQEAAADYGA